MDTQSLSNRKTPLGYAPNNKNSGRPKSAMRGG